MDVITFPENRVNLYYCIKSCVTRYQQPCFNRQKTPCINLSKLLAKFLSEKMTLCNNNDQTWFSDTLTSARPLGVVKTLAFQAPVSTPPSGSSRC